MASIPEKNISSFPSCPSIPSITMTGPDGGDSEDSVGHHSVTADLAETGDQDHNSHLSFKPPQSEEGSGEATNHHPTASVGNSLLPPKPSGRRSGSRRLRRASSARERERERVRPRVRRSISMQGAADGKTGQYSKRPSRRHGGSGGGGGHRRSRPSSLHSNVSSDAASGSKSSVKDAAASEHTNSLVEIVAVELGITDGSGISPKERRRRRIVFAVILTTMIILTASVMLVAITLILSPAVDAALRKENEEIYRVMASIPTTPPPAQDVARVNHTSTTTGQPG